MFALLASSCPLSSTRFAFIGTRPPVLYPTTTGLICDGGAISFLPLMVFPSSRLLRGSPILGIFPPTLVTLAPAVTFRVSFSTRLSLGRSSTVSGLISTCWNCYPSWSPSSSGAPPYGGPVLFSSVTTTTASSPLTLVARGLPACNGVCVKFGFFPHFMTLRWRRSTFPAVTTLSPIILAVGIYLRITQTNSSC